MSKILVATEKPFSPLAIAEIRKAVPKDFTLELLESYADKTQLLEAVADATALIVRSEKIDKEVVDAGKKLKVIVRAGAGYDNVDLVSTKEAGVAVMNTPGQNANAVAELAFGLLIFMLRKKFAGKLGNELRGKTIGIHGYGNIGAHISHIAQGFGMYVKTLTKMIRPETSGVVMTPAVEDMYSTSDIISLHMPALPDTLKSINHHLFDLMKDGSILLNTARKEIINEEELIGAMRQKTKMCFISDIMPENASKMQEEFGDRVFFTPKKMGAQTEEANINAGVAAVKQIVDYIALGQSSFIVNR